MSRRKKITFQDELPNRQLASRDSIAQELYGTYIGWDKEPYTANCTQCTESGTIAYGDRVQLRLDVHDHGITHTQQLCQEHKWESLPPEIQNEPGISALVTMETNGIPTIPIVEGGWPTDYDLEGRKELNPWRFEPCNDAVHLGEIVSWDAFHK